MNHIDLNLLKNTKFKFVELDDYDEFEMELLKTHENDKKRQTLYLMKIPMQKDPNGRTYNAISLLDEKIKLRIEPDKLIKPMIYQKLTSTKEAQYDKKRRWDMKQESAKNSYDFYFKHNDGTTPFL